MSDKLEALKAVERFDAEIEMHGGESFAVWSPAPSGSHVSAKDYDALLAALEELKAKTSTCMGVGNGSGNLFVYGDYDSIKAAQRIVLDSEKLRAALEEKDQELDKEGDILIDTQESMREWKLRANAAEQREEHLKATVDVLSAKNAELQQRLKQPIKLPKREIGMSCEFVSDHIVVSLAAVLVEAATAGFKAEVEGE